MKHAGGGQHQSDGDADGHHRHQGPVNPQRPPGLCTGAANSVKHQRQRSNQQYAAGIDHPRVCNQRAANNERGGSVPRNQLRDNSPAAEASRRQEVLAYAQDALRHSSDENEIRRRPRPVLKMKRTSYGGDEATCHNAQQRHRAEGQCPLDIAYRPHR